MVVAVMFLAQSNGQCQLQSYKELHSVGKLDWDYGQTQNKLYTTIINHNTSILHKYSTPNKSIHERKHSM